MPYSEDDLLPLSALQHLLFCERQCALIHVERLWADNRFTAEGNHLHEKAHAGKPETRDGVRISRGLPLHSLQLGLSGQADVIEWRLPSEQRRSRKTLAQVLQTATADERRRWHVRPVEYKRGQPKQNDCDRVQLCAQAICLEEMLGITVLTGELFYGQKRRRFEVTFDDRLRNTTTEAALRLHEIIDRHLTPPAVRDARCDSCSLFSFCLPDVTSTSISATAYVRRMLKS